MSLVGKYVVVSGGEFFHIGHIIEEIASEIFLIEFEGKDAGKDISYRHIFSLREMLTTIEKDGSLNSHWTFFDTRERIDQWFDQISSIELDDEMPEGITLQ